jgi:GT2 family glycosyltransferase
MRIDESEEGEAAAAGAAPICSVVIVGFHSGAKLAACLASLFGDVPRAARRTEAIYVNNSTADGDEVAAICAGHGAEFVQNASNLGYGPACNVGAARARGKFVMFLNPDVRITPADIEGLAALALADPAIVAIGPLQQGKNGRIKSKRHSVGQPKGAVAAEAGETFATGFLSGGALMVSRSAFDAVGGFDPEIFLFHEDDDLCLRLSRIGRLVYAKNIVVGHEWGASTPPSPLVTRVRSWHLGYSKAYVLRKHYGARASLAALGDAVLKFLSPAMVTRRGRLKAVSFFGGVVQSIRQSGIRNVPE